MVKRELQMSNEKRGTHLTALDYFIIFAVVAALVCGGLRLYKNSHADDVRGKTSEYDEYVVSFVSRSIKESTAKLLEKGDTFYIDGGKTEFGVLEDNPTVTPARLSLELDNGEYIGNVYAEKNGNNTLVDAAGAVRVKGYMDNNGLIYLQGKEYIAPNLTVTLFGSELSLTVEITDIERVS